ncbi:MAG: AIR synthase family protein [Acetivibrio sp.]
MEMKRGKIPETILKRSILKQRKHRRSEVIQGALPGLDASIVDMKETEELVISINPVIGELKGLPDQVVHTTANNIWVQGGEPIGILTSVLLPENIKEEELRDFTQKLEKICESLNIEIMGGHTEVASIPRPIITVTGIGKRKKKGTQRISTLRPSLELVMTRFAGQEGTAILAREKKRELKTRYTEEYLEKAYCENQGISVFDAVKVAGENGVTVMHDVTGGGIFGALWELGSAYQVGFSVDLKKIPIRQETIEICEFFDLNPYMLTSRGCLLMVSEHGNELVQKLSEAKIEAAVIGRITENKDKQIVNEDEIRFLDSPKEEELLKVL